MKSKRSCDLKKRASKNLLFFLSRVPVFVQARVIIFCRAHKVITTGVKCWPVSGSELRSPLDETVDHVGLFRDDEIYIVRWSFYTELTGIRSAPTDNFINIW